MRAVIAILISLGLLVVLLRLKIKTGRAMIIVAVLLTVLLGVWPSDLWNQLAREWHEKSFTDTSGYLFVSISALVMLVNVLGAAMGKVGITERLMPAMHGLFRSRRIAISIIPFMMGMLPTPGGIMLSAPMVRDMGDKVGLNRAKSAAINFYFRHQWEPVWPLFPAIPFAEGFLGVSAAAIIAHNAVIVAAGLLGGVVFLLLIGFPPKDKNQQISAAPMHHHLGDFAHAFWPVLFAAVLYAALNVPPALGILIAIIGFLTLHKVPLKSWGQLFKSGKDIDLPMLIFGALFFKLVLQAGGAIETVTGLMIDYNIPRSLIIFFLPFTVICLTGLTSATVALTFPLLAPMIGTGDEARLGLSALAFAGITCGLSITPIHLCLVLSAEYFDTSVIKIVKAVIPALLFVLAAGILMAIFF